MPFFIVRNDIAQMDVDIVVNAANSYLLETYDGVCGALFAGAGSELMQGACREAGFCEVGDAVITPSFNLPARAVIHAVGPIWRGGMRGEPEQLRSCYDAIFRLAKENNAESLAFPLISSGAFAYPRASAMAIALEAVSVFLAENEMMVYLVVYDRETVQLSNALFNSIQEYIDDYYVFENGRSGERDLYPATVLLADAAGLFATQDLNTETPCAYSAKTATLDLRSQLEELDESFSQCLFRLIDERSLTDVEVYKRANVSRKLFSKIRSDAYYRPSKQTVLALAVALRLDLSEAKSLLEKAGFALSRSSKADVVMEHFFIRRVYDIFAINEALFAFGQPILGSSL